MVRTNKPVEVRVRRAVKSINVSLSDVRRIIDKSGELDVIAGVRSVKGHIRVVVRAKCDLPIAWSTAILLDNKRIDGIDWEQRVRDHRGKNFDCSGWHRHIWKLGDAHQHKECLSGFAPQTLDQFLSEVFALMRVKLKEGGAHGEQLSLDKASPS